MDNFLIDYLRSGNAWVLVGSGPSIEMGYPSWEELAAFAVEAAKIEGAGQDFRQLDRAMRRKEFPRVFERARGILGGPRLLQVLHAQLAPHRPGEIYKLIARWPVRVYLTTNYDDEVQRHIAQLGEAYTVYSNSEDHLSYLLPDLSGAIFKLHGDLRSEVGLILTNSQYREIAEGEALAYWRTRMTSVFQMSRMVVVGHSLTDNNFKHVFESARQGAGVLQPVCWIAPDVPLDQARDYLEKYRIRVISYPNRDGTHRSLLQLLESVSEFVPPRTTVRIRESIARVSQSQLGNNAAAPGFFVFSKLLGQRDYDQRRIDVIVAIIQSALPALAAIGRFSLQAALEIAGWPSNLPLPDETARLVAQNAVSQGLLAGVGDEFTVGPESARLAAEARRMFEHTRDRFRSSLEVRIRRAYPGLSESEASTIASDIDQSLTGYFREGGLSLATTLFSRIVARRSPVPSSIVSFINEASTRYDDLLKRQAFFTTSVDAFVHAEAAEREYLGRISQGFFAFHSLGVFGDVALQRLQEARATVWLVDSSAQIPALALAAPMNHVFADTFSRLKAAGIRFFATEGLFEETREHHWFANRVTERGVASPDVMLAAQGQAPYRKGNLFLEGFIRWQAAGNPRDWASYLFQVFGTRNPTRDGIRRKLRDIGIQVVPLRDWPGFQRSDTNVLDEYVERIARLLDASPLEVSDRDFDPRKKAGPEAEAALVVNRERQGTYHILSNEGESSPSWFVSSTSILNTLVEDGSRITWQPEAFLSFASTLAPVDDAKAADTAFETLLWGLAETGLSLLDEATVTEVFGGVIDQAALDILEQQQLYRDTLQEKYGESLQSVLERIAPIHRPLAAIQLSYEMSELQAKRLESAEKRRSEAEARAAVAEKKLKDVDRFVKKVEAKRAKARRKQRRPKERKKRRK